MLQQDVARLRTELNEVTEQMQGRLATMQALEEENRRMQAGAAGEGSLKEQFVEQLTEKISVQLAMRQQQQQPQPHPPSIANPTSPPLRMADLVPQHLGAPSTASHSRTVSPVYGASASSSPRSHSPDHPVSTAASTHSTMSTASRRLDLKGAFIR